jgi:predicted transposase YdaD
MTYPNHDELFAASMGIIEIAQQCLQRVLPPRVRQYAKFHTLQRKNGTFVGKNQKHLSDMLYSIDWEGLGQGFIYCLAEHKAQPDKLLPLQTGRYVYEILQDWKTQQEAAKQPTFPLPLVYVVIFYHGKQSPYPHSTDIRDCFGNREMAETLFNEPYHMVVRHGSCHDIAGITSGILGRKYPD